MDGIDNIKKTTADYPRFSDGRIDYSNERICFALNCVIVYKDEILLTKRSANVMAYPNTFNGISGFIDRTDVSIIDIAKIELEEEIDMPFDLITNMTVSDLFIQNDSNLDREWHLYSVLVEVSKKFTPTINWENKAADWYKIKDVPSMELMPGFEDIMNTALALRKS